MKDKLDTIWSSKPIEIDFTNLLGWLGLYSDMSKVGNVNLPGREIDKHDEISG